VGKEGGEISSSDLHHAEYGQQDQYRDLRHHQGYLGFSGFRKPSQVEGREEYYTSQGTEPGIEFCSY
jgi:hypothetical protein